MLQKLCFQQSSFTFLNQARTGLQPAHAWFLEIDFVHDVCCVCVCVSAPEAINN